MGRKERPYQFLTSGSTMVEVKATNPLQAYTRAGKEHKRLGKELKRKFGIDTGKLTRNYVTFGRSGFAPVGIYKQVKQRKKRR